MYTRKHQKNSVKAGVRQPRRLGRRLCAQPRHHRLHPGPAYHQPFALFLFDFSIQDAPTFGPGSQQQFHAKAPHIDLSFYMAKRTAASR